MRLGHVAASVLVSLGACAGTPPPASTPAPAAHTSKAMAPRCELGPPAETLHVEGADAGELHELHDLPDEPWLWAAAPPDDDREAFRRAVSGRMQGRIAPRELLERQRAIYAAIDGPMRGEADNGTAVLEGRAGAIAPASCLEASLWRRQAARFPMLEHPTELGAFILRGHGRVRVYLSSADRVGQKVRSVVIERVRADGARGFDLVAHLHNHPFLFDRVVGDRMWTLDATRDDVAGALAPSLTDVQFWRRAVESSGLKGAWITNGIDSIHFTAQDFERLSAAE